MPTEREAQRDAVRRLRLPSTIRERCANITAAVIAGDSPHFTLDASRLGEVARRVARLTLERFPSLHVPYHSRWRHFEAGGVDRKAILNAQFAGRDAVDIARAQIELTLVSVLLDAGAGPDWRYQEAASGRRFAHSEGLALASFHAFVEGRFSSDLREPCRVDATALERMDTLTLASIFQANEGNPLVGLEGRAVLLRRLGQALRERPKSFGPLGRPGYLFDVLTHPSVSDTVSELPGARVAVQRVGAPHILRALLKAFSGIWPSGQMLGREPVGDVWPHRHAGGEGPDAGRVPFHKLSQWLTYSLVEPFEGAGVQVDRLDELTGLPEYRNGGLLLDGGVILPRDPAFSTRIYAVSEPWVIEWRALTVTLLDELAQRVRAELREPRLSLARVLEGGTWLAGRQLAAELRPGGPPPVRVASDGTVF